MTERPSDQRAPTAPLQSTEHTVTLADGTALFYRAWMQDTPSQHALLLFHRGPEHSARWLETVEALALDDAPSSPGTRVGTGGRQARPSIIVRPEVWQALHTFAQTRSLNPDS